MCTRKDNDNFPKMDKKGHEDGIRTNNSDGVDEIKRKGEGTRNIYPSDFGRFFFFFLN